MYDARIAEQEILTPPPAAAPRINGPKVYGARPDKAFVYRIPTQGARPMVFEVEGLPPSLTLDAGRGILGGRSPRQRGAYRMTLHARNGQGRAWRGFVLVVGDQLALTPPTGWNHWGGHASNISDGIIRSAADLFVQGGLADVGYQFIGLDDGWMRMAPAEYERIQREKDEGYLRKHRGLDFARTVGAPRDAGGNILPNGLFPDMKGLADYIHGFGLRAGIYSSPGPMTCQSLEGSAGHEEQDARQFAAWGYDLLKYDECSAGKLIAQARRERPDFELATFWRPMVASIEQTDRDLVFNLCQYGAGDPWRWAPGIGVQTWRTGGDLNHHLERYFDQALRIATTLRAFNGPGHWNDPDFLYVGRQVQTRGNHFVAAADSGLDSNQEYQYVSLWAMVCAPMFFSTDVNHVSDFTLGLLSNPEVMAINQDELGHTAEVLENESKRVVMLKRLADGFKALGVFNRDAEAEVVVEIDGAALTGKRRWAVRDVWRQRDLGLCENGLAVRLSPNGVGLFRLG